MVIGRPVRTGITAGGVTECSPSVGPWRSLKAEDNLDTVHRTEPAQSGRREAQYCVNALSEPCYRLISLWLTGPSRSSKMCLAGFARNPGFSRG